MSLHIDRCSISRVRREWHGFIVTSALLYVHSTNVKTLWQAFLFLFSHSLACSLACVPFIFCVVFFFLPPPPLFSFPFFFLSRRRGEIESHLLLFWKFNVDRQHAKAMYPSLSQCINLVGLYIKCAPDAVLFCNK